MATCCGWRPDAPKVIDEVPVGRMVVETDGLVGTGDDIFRTRRRLMNHGTILASLVLDDHGSVLAAPQLTPLGRVRARALRRAARRLPATPSPTRSRSSRTPRRPTTSACATRSACAIRQALDLPRHRRPIVEVQITRLGADTLAAFEPMEEAVP